MEEKGMGGEARFGMVSWWRLLVTEPPYFRGKEGRI